MEENPASTILDGEIIGIRFGLATHHEICTASISDCPISHASQLANPFLGLPLEFGKCESCGTSEPGKCEGHFGYIELPIPIYHPSHVGELKRMLSLLCLKCLKMRRNKVPLKSAGLAERLLSSCCEDSPQVSIREVKTTDGACYLELKLPQRSLRDGSWNFLEIYGFRYGDDFHRTLLPCEVRKMLKRIPEETRKKLSGKGYFPQEGYILKYLPVPPNCLSVPEISDGVSVMSSDPSLVMLKKVLRQVEIIKSSRSGTPNFESHEVEANELQSAVNQYLQIRGSVKASRDIDSRFGLSKEPNDSTTKAWLEKIRTLFIRKGSGFSSRSVITGDAYKRVDEIGIPFEIAQMITFEEKVNVHNLKYLQELVDNKLCLTYRDGSSAYSLREGSKGHTFLRPGQVVHRRIMDGDMVFINRPPTTHKHSLQALAVYVHDDHTVKINPLICGPLSADFDGDCVHLFYPQSLAAKAEVLELFSVDKQLLSSHSGKINLQLATDSLLSLKTMFKTYFLDRSATQQLAMFASSSLPRPALLKVHSAAPYWTALQILQTALPACFDCCGETYLISQSDVLKIDFNSDVISSVVNEIVTSIFFEKGPEEVLKFFNSLQPLLMENIFAEGFSVGLNDFSINREDIKNIQKNIQSISPLLYHLRATYNELVELQLENCIKDVKVPVTNFILKSALGDLMDSKNDSAINKVVQQIGFLGLQLSDKGKFYSKTLVEDVAALFRCKYLSGVDYPSAEYGLVQNCFFHGLDPYEEIVHSISTREVMVRSSRGLSEPGTLFKNLMAILRDVVICYDGTVRNVSSNSIIQFDYGVKARGKPNNLFPAGEPVGVLAATAMSNPAYKAVLDSSPSSNSSWELMKEILLCKVIFKNELIDRRVVLYLNECGCGRKCCREKAAYLVKNQLKKVSLKDTAVEFLIEYKDQQNVAESSEVDAGLVGHIHLNEMLLGEMNTSMHEVLQKCQETLSSFRKKKKVAHVFKQTILSISECCSFQQCGANRSSGIPCLMFSWPDTSGIYLERTANILADIICPVLLETIIKGDHRVCSANIIWINPGTTTWIRNPCKSQEGELALDIVLEKSAVKQSGDAWRIVLDCCLPVLHLIDTRRSIPYAIKQLQELLGISCAFDQAVQRLATSVTMVAKGVLKEHLILLANSMTCAGNLVGFNSGGYKALSRSFNVQAPFAEATLFTPRNCFERSAEKRHVDSLSSIVASCSWGKHVAVGTGSRFDVLWDTRQVGLNEEGGIDVYNFLHMVRSTANGEESNTGCLGADTDDLMLEDECAEWAPSPEHNSSFDKPFFEDSAEFENCLDNQPGESTWDASTSWDKQMTRENASSGWGTNKAEPGDVSTKPAVDSSKSSGWGAMAGWENNTATKNDSSGWGMGGVSKKAQENSSTSHGWDAVAPLGKVSKDVEESGWEKNTVTKNVSSVWGTNKAESGDVSPKAAEKSSKSSGWGGVAGWDINSATKNDSSGWGTSGDQSRVAFVSKKVPENSSRSHSWDAVIPWGKGDKDVEKNTVTKNVSSGWGMGGEKSRDGFVSKTEQENSSGSHGWDAVTPLGKRDGDGEENSLNKNVSSGWGTGGDESRDAFVSKKAQDNSSRSCSWDAATPSGKNAGDAVESGSCRFDGKPLVEKRTEPFDWDKKVTQETVQSTSGWVSSTIEVGTRDEHSSPSVEHCESPALNNSWGQLKSPEPSQGWGSWNESNQLASLNSWDSPNADGGNESERPRWGRQSAEPFKKNSFEGSRGWGSNSGERKSNWSAKSPGRSHTGSSASGIYTATRQRLDMFTSEEQDVLLDIEKIMQSIRRIMHQSGLAGISITRIAGASTLSQLMVVRKIFPIANAWITSSRTSIQTLLKHSLQSISESPVLEETGKAIPFQRKRVKS
ncbi:hypothetical protein I3760_13G013300 [Carya illinoinensis]|nr:hypothetical protein I3760_13G013300 [Carya illinoinensis]